MNTINKDELFGQVREFLKAKGIDLQDGSYTRRIEKGCGLLARTINGGCEVLARAKSGASERLDQVRQVIHEKTAPRRTAEATTVQPPIAPAIRTAPTSPASPGKAKSVRRRPTPRAAKAERKRK